MDLLPVYIFFFVDIKLLNLCIKDPRKQIFLFIQCKSSSRRQSKLDRSRLHAIHMYTQIPFIIDSPYNIKLNGPLGKIQIQI